MYPILLSFGPVTIASLSVFLILSWIVWSFLFWKYLRSVAAAEPLIFDLMFTVTLWAFVGARAGYVVFHTGQFAGNILRVAAIWVQPGLSLYGGIIGGMIAAVVMALRSKLKLSDIMDAMAFALPPAIATGLVGGFLDGGVVGKVARLPWAVPYIGHLGRRHPVQVYELLVTIAVIVLSAMIRRRVVKRGLPAGIAAAWTAIVWSPALFALEFAKDTPVYWNAIGANQVVLIVAFGQAVGAVYVYGGGKQLAARTFGSIRSRITTVIGGMYAKLSKRPAQPDQNPS